MQGFRLRPGGDQRKQAILGIPILQVSTCVNKRSGLYYLNSKDTESHYTGRDKLQCERDSPNLYTVVEVETDTHYQLQSKHAMMTKLKKLTVNEIRDHNTEGDLNPTVQLRH